MRWLFVLNGLGAVTSAVYAGWVVSPRWIPWWAMIAAGVYLLGILLPIVIMQFSLGGSFRSMERDFLKKTRAPWFPSNAPEVFTNTPQGPRVRTTPMPVRSTVAAFVVACALFAWDVSGFVQVPPPEGESGTFSNF